MVYDVARREIVLFGGALIDESGRGGPDRSDLWAWNGQSWRRLRPTDGVEPPPRGTAHLVYDAARERIILFGGRRPANNGGVEIMGDVWEWDRTRWHEAKDTISVLHATVAYDASRNRAVMFGGLDRANDLQRMRAVRDWDGKTWRVQEGSALAAVGPTAPVASSFSQRGDYIIVDEQSGNSSDSVATVTRIWNGQAWARGELGPAITSLQPQAAAPDGTIYIYQRSAPWLSAPVMHTRRPNGEWTHVVVDAEPLTRGFPALVFDAARQQLMMYGDGLWAWRSPRWERVDTGPTR